MSAVANRRTTDNRTWVCMITHCLGADDFNTSAKVRMLCGMPVAVVVSVSLVK